MNSSPTSPTSEALAAARRAAWAALTTAQPPAWVLAHCQAVEGLAIAMCTAAERQALLPNRALVHQGALLHDIGRSVAQDVSHASRGAALLRAAAWPEPVVRIVERHTGAGIDAAEAAALGLPVKDYTPRSLEQRIVCHADNLYSGERRLSMGELGEKYRAKQLPAAWSKILALHTSLCDELGVDLEGIAPAALTPP